jgi:hypothetical protein
MSPVSIPWRCADSARRWRPEDRGPRPLAAQAPSRATPHPQKSQGLARLPISGPRFPDFTAPIPGIFLSGFAQIARQTPSASPVHRARSRSARLGAAQTPGILAFRYTRLNTSLHTEELRPVVIASSSRSAQLGIERQTSSAILRLSVARDGGHQSSRRPAISRKAQNDPSRTSASRA